MANNNIYSYVFIIGLVAVFVVYCTCITFGADLLNMNFLRDIKKRRNSEELLQKNNDINV